MAERPGLFTNAGIKELDSASDPNTYVMTPKYNDPYAADQDRKMAKFLISSGLRAQINKVLASSKDTILSKLEGDALGITGRGYFDFLLQSVDESFEEKFQIVETLGDSYAVFGLGRKPRIVNFTGVLLNSVENDWRINFIKMYEKYLSITSLSKFRSGSLKNVATMIYDSVTIQGAILNLRTGLRSDNELATQFSFAMLVTKSTTFNLNEVLAVASKKTPVVAKAPVEETKGVVDTDPKFITLKNGNLIRTDTTSEAADYVNASKNRRGG